MLCLLTSRSPVAKADHTCFGGNVLAGMSWREYLGGNALAGNATPGLHDVILQQLH